MTWQDITLTTIMILLSYALLPQIYQGFKKKKGLINIQTSAITTLGLYIISVVYFTLGLYLSTIIAFINGILWAILFFQKIIYK